MYDVKTVTDEVDSDAERMVWCLDHAADGRQTLQLASQQLVGCC